MSNLIKFPGGGMPAKTEDLVAGLQNVTSHIGPSAGGTPFLRLGKDGIWVYGQENIDVEEGSLWAINPYSIQHGFAAWGDGELFGEVMVPFNQAPPQRGSLQDYGVEWKAQTSMLMQCTSGEDKGQVVMYKGTSIGMQNAVKELVNALINQIQANPKNIVPVVALDVDSYTHKKYGQTFVPIIDIQSWVSMETGETSEDPAEEDADKPTDKPTAKAADKTEDDDGAQPAEKPTSRRRRGAAKDEPKPEADGNASPTSRRRRRR